MSVRTGGRIIADTNKELPTQAGNSGKFLKTDGANATWQNVTASDAGALPSSTKYAKSFTLSINNTTYVLTATLKDQDGNTLGSAQTVDLPLETMVVSGAYDADTKKIILTLQNGQTIEFSVADLVSGLQETLVSGTNIKTINNTSLLGSGDMTIDGLPTQTGQGGKYLTTDGSSASWSTVDPLPTQTGNSGKLLTTNGTSASWTEIKTINSDSLVGSGNIDVLVNEATPASSLGVGYTTINTTYTDSVNIGNGAQVLANNALALGAFASAEGQDSIAIYSSTGTAHRARTTHTGNIAIGYNALAINAAYTIAIGYNAYAQGANSIQLGTGQVALQNTFQVWTYPMLNKTSGLIPAARFADQTSATEGQLLALDANLDAVWKTVSVPTITYDGTNKRLVIA